jgi:hypothetical protein
MKDLFYILSIDGGGIRGVYSAKILARMEEVYEIDWPKSFHLMAGTSTGSIIAAGLAFGLTASSILEIYRKHGQRIFSGKMFAGTGLAGSRFSSKHLKNVLKDTFADTKLEDIRMPLIVPSTDVGNGHVHVFKSAYDPGFVRDKNVLLRDAILASCAAPTYFDPEKTGDYLLADGGLWANNPALVAVVDAKRRFGQRLENLRILSIGAGSGKSYYSQNEKLWKRWLGWGFLTKWGRGKFIDMLLNLQAETANNMLGLLLANDQILRINYASDRKLTIADTGEMENLISKADSDFTRAATKIGEFFLPSPTASS